MQGLVRLRNDGVKCNYTAFLQRIYKINDVQAAVTTKDTELVLDIHQLNGVILVQCLGNPDILIGVILVYLKDNLPAIDISNDLFDIHGYDHRPYPGSKQTVHSPGEVLSKGSNATLSGWKSTNVDYLATVPSTVI